MEDVSKMLSESDTINYVGENTLRALIDIIHQFPYNIGKSFWIGTKAEYLALDEWDDNTIYFIKEIQAQDAAIEEVKEE